MPIYCFSDDRGNVVERFHEIGKCPRKIRIKGRTYRHDLGAEHSGFRNTPGTYPMVSEAAGVAPDQVPEMMRQCKAAGISGMRFDSTGAAVFADKSIRKRFCEMRGLYDRNGGYGDPRRRS